MSKYGKGSVDPSAAGGIRVPTVDDNLKETLQNAMGDIAQSPDQTVAPEDQAESMPEQMDYGWTPEGDLVPLPERAGMMRKGEMTDPNFPDWKKTGGGVSPDMGAPTPNPEQSSFGGDQIGDIPGMSNRNNIPNVKEVPYESVYSPDPLSGIAIRAGRVAKAMTNLAGNPGTRISFDRNPSTANRDTFVSLNKQIAAATDPMLRKELELKRGELTKGDVKAAKEGAQSNTLLHTLNDAIAATIIDPVTGFTQVDPKFAQIASLAAEESLYMRTMGDQARSENFRTDEEMDVADDTLIEQFDDPEAENIVDTNRNVNPAEAALSTGKEVLKWWKAQKNSEGEPANYKLTNNQMMELGTAALMSYAGTFPDLVHVVENQNVPSFLKLSVIGENELRFSAPARTQLMGNMIAPFKVPQPSGNPRAMGEVKPTNKKQKLHERGRTHILREALENQNNVGHVVDTTRTRILLAMLLPSLYLPVGDKRAVYADVFGIGGVSHKTSMMTARDIKGLPEQDAHAEAASISQSKKASIAKQMKAIAQARNGANYLTYAVQGYTLRSAPTQTIFNPTASKITRFVTRSKTPGIIRPNHTFDNPNKNAYFNIMALSFGKDEYLEKGRIKDLLDNKEHYRNWGQQLKDALLFSMDADKAEVIMTALESGQPLPEFGKDAMAFHSQLTPDLQDFLAKKGEDSMQAIDNLIDFAEYWDSMDKGVPHITFVNAYADGKQNGIALQSTMLGIEPLALMTGVFRSNDSELALEGNDVRGALRDFMLEELAKGNNAKIPEHKKNQMSDPNDMVQYEVMQMLAKEKQINKIVTMVFPYGKELRGLQDEIRNILPLVRASNSQLDHKITQLTLNDPQKLDVLIATHHANMVNALFSVFGERTFQARSMMRGFGYLAALTDSEYGIIGPTGAYMPISDQGLDTAKSVKTSTQVTVDNEEGRRKLPSIYTQDTPTYGTAAASRPSSRNPRLGEAAGFVRGRGGVTATQSMDAGTVLTTFSGNSFQKIKDAHPDGDPYIYQVFDAVKVDVFSYTPTLEEMNKNFLNITTRDWSFIEQGLAEHKKLMKKYKKKFSDMQDDYYTLYPYGHSDFQYIPKGRMDTTFNYLGRLLDPEKNDEGMPTRQTMKSLVKSLFPIDTKGKFLDKSLDNNRLRHYDSNIDGSETFKGDDISVVEIMKTYENFVTGEAQRLTSAILNVLNSMGNEYTLSKLPDTITPDEAIAVFEFIEEYSGIQKDAEKLIAAANVGRAKIREKENENYRLTGQGAAQFWQH